MAGAGGFDREKAIELAVNTIQKQFGKGALCALVTGLASRRYRCDLDRFHRLGRGTWNWRSSRGRIVEIYGPESSGKTTLTLHAVAEAQKAGGVAAFVDAEHALDVTYAKKLGVNTDDLLVSQPDTGEQALKLPRCLCVQMPSISWYRLRCCLGTARGD